MKIQRTVSTRFCTLHRIPRVCWHILIRNLLVLLWRAHSLSSSKYFVYTLYFCLLQESTKILEKLHNEELNDLHLPNTAYYLGDQTNDGKMDGVCVMCEREEE
jgi:hypothetical protein